MPSRAGRRRRHRSQGLLASAFLAPATGLFGAFFVVPAGYAAYLSLRASTVAGGGIGVRQERYVGLRNYRDVLAAPEFLAGILRMLAYCAIVVPIMLGLALLSALLLDSPLPRFRRPARLSIFLPYAVPTVIASLLWGFLYLPVTSPISDVFEAFGLTPPKLLEGTLVYGSVANIAIWGGVGFNMIVMFTSLRATPEELLDAARIDGCNELQLALRVKIPLLVPSLVMTGVFSTIATLQVYNEPATLRPLTDAISSTWMPMMKIYRDAFIVGDYYLAATGSLLFGGCLLVVSSVALRVLQRRAFGEGPVTTLDPEAAWRAIESDPLGRHDVVQRRRSLLGWRIVSTGLLVLGACYCLFPVSWVLIASTKTRAELFSTFTMMPGLRGGFLDNLEDLNAYGNGEFWRWAANSLLYAGGGALASVAVSALAGYALAVYRFRGRTTVFNTVLAAVLLPQVVLVVPQYLMFSRLGLTDTYWSVLLPSILSPYGIYLMRVYIGAATPVEMLEAARIDGAPEWRVFVSVALPTMMPGLVTAFLLQFVACWNLFLLPYVMIADDRKYPMTVGLLTLLNQGANQPALYSLAIMGALLAIVPIILLFLVLQRFWSLDLVSGALKG